MRTLTIGSPQLKPGAARRKENVLKGVKRKGEIEFTEESGLLILIKRITKAQFKERMKRTAISLAVWRLMVCKLNCTRNGTNR
jgi:hypothetical protein